MELSIYWTDFSKSELKKIFNHYKENASIYIARKLVTGIVKETLKLRKHPNIGQDEELLKNEPRVFKYIVYKSYKIIYLVDMLNNRIDIFDVFDTRQNPKKMKRTS